MTFILTVILPSFHFFSPFSLPKYSHTFARSDHLYPAIHLSSVPPAPYPGSGPFFTSLSFTTVTPGHVLMRNKMKHMSFCIWVTSLYIVPSIYLQSPCSFFFTIASISAPYLFVFVCGRLCHCLKCFMQIPCAYRKAPCFKDICKFECIFPMCLELTILASRKQV